MAKGRGHSAFTLIELLLVVSVLAILAALVYPHFTHAKDDTDDKALRAQLQTIRNQIELYKAAHDGKIPDLVTDWNALTNPPPYKGKAVPPYLPLPPENCLNGMTNVVEGNGTAAAGSICGFVYDYSGGAGSGRIFATRGNGTTIFFEQ